MPLRGFAKRRAVLSVFGLQVLFGSTRLCSTVTVSLHIYVGVHKRRWRLPLSVTMFRGEGIMRGEGRETCPTFFFL